MFDPRTLDPNNGGGTGGKMLATYTTDDNAAVVEADGYFDAGAQEFVDLRIGAILCFMGDATKIYKATSDGADVTLAALDAVA